MIEVQGKIVLDNDGSETTADSSSALSVGEFVFPPPDDVTDSDSLDDWDGRRVFLFVGKHQRLTGEVKKLNKPLAVIRRRGDTEASPLVAFDDKEESSRVAPSSSQDLEIVEIITQKIMFAHRPEPIGVDLEPEVDPEKV
jgi:chromosome transmission fidelity protein 8